MDPDEESSTRFNLTVYMLGAVLIIVLVVMLLSAFNVATPEFVSGVVVMGFIGMLKDAYMSYFKARETIDAVKTETAKVEAVAQVEAKKVEAAKCGPTQ